MPTSVLIAVALSVLLGILVFFTVPRAAGSRKHVDFPQVRWNINRGSGAYLTMLDQLRNLAEPSAENVAITGDTKSRNFADIMISGGNDHTPAVHAIVRLSDFCIVRFFSNDTPHDFVLNLAPDVPNHEDTDDNWFLGKEGYEALVRVANLSLTAVNLNESSLENSLRDLGIRGTDRLCACPSQPKPIRPTPIRVRVCPPPTGSAAGMEEVMRTPVLARARA